MLGRFLLAVVLVLGVVTVASADDLRLTGAAKWVVLASSPSLVEVDSVVGDYEQFYDLRFVRVRNGRFALVLGPVTNFDLAGHKRDGLIKPDAYFSDGSDLLETVMTLDNHSGTGNRVAEPEVPGATYCSSIRDPMQRVACYDRAASGSKSFKTVDVEVADVAPKPAPAAQLPTPVAAPEPVVKAPPVAQTRYGPENAAVPTKLTLSFQPEDFEQSILFDRVEMRMSFRNGWVKKIVGISHRFEVLNAFGDVLVKGKDNLDISVPHGEEVASSTFYSWDNNPFISKEPYDRLIGAVNNKTYKINLTVEKVIFGDGTVLQVNPST